LIVKNSLYCCYGVFKVHADSSAHREHRPRSYGAGLSKLSSERTSRGRR
jgi:hypothetical protein